MRTGDLGFWEDEAGLFITGRIKDILIIRGRNHYPQDIEHTVESSHPALIFHSTAAFSVEIDGSDCLFIASEVKRTYLRNLKVEEVVKAIRQKVLSEHDLQVERVLLLKPGTLPKTSSGKIQRLVCRELFLTDNLPLVASEAKVAVPDKLPQQYSLESIQNWVFQWLAAKLHISVLSIDQKESFETYGLDSLAATKFIEDLEKWSGYLLNISQLQSFSAIANLVEYLAQEIAHQDKKPATEIPAEYYQFEYFPENTQLQQRLTECKL